MKSILMSIQPKWAELEMNSKKTIEVRKFYIEPPFKVVNYVTKRDSLIYSKDYEDLAWSRPYIDKENNRVWTTLKGNFLWRLCKDRAWNGKVAYEYVVNKVDTIPPCTTHNGLHYPLASRPELAKLVKKACLTNEELFLYGVKKNQGCYGASSKVVPLYAMHISDLIIYDKPKELGEFRKPCNHKIVYGEKVSSCGACRMWRMNYKTFTYECILGGKVKITRPPQNFVYVEEIRCCQSEVQNDK